MSVMLPVVDIPAPIRESPAGTYRVGDTKVLLEAFIWAYNHESPTPELLHEAWPVVEMPVVYAVLSFYHEHRAEVDAYVENAGHEQDRFIEEQRRLHPEAPTFEELVARLRARESIAPTREGAALLKRLERHESQPGG